MSRIAVSIQTLDGHKDTYLRAVCKSLGEVEGTVKEMLADPEAYTIGKFKSTFPKRRALRGDEDKQVKEAVQQIAAAA
ncbi:MAG: hypothetical protein ACYDHN_01695 [Solirubrobacteraceae bacterium]